MTERTSSERAALVAIPESEQQRAFGRWVEAAGFVPQSAETAEKARAELERRAFELVVASPALYENAIPEPLRNLEAVATPVVAVSADADDAPVRSGGGCPGLVRVGPLIGRSRPMQRVFDRIVRVAPTAATVLLLGESGTGKELAAGLVHALGPRSSGPFVPVNCGAISAGLIESELFGHERGSFTGADRRRAGLFERAAGGTLFLDEITEMPIELQVRLLRVLESGKLRRVGGEGQIDVDVRVVAATNVDPEKAVADGRLRRDLFYRLMVFPIALPPLRERVDDVELIARQHLVDLARRGRDPKKVTEESLECLRSHAWPGNVRELRNALSRASILALDGEITPDCLVLDRTEVAARDDDLGIRVGMSIADAERRMILATLQDVGGDKKKAAKILGVSVKTVYNRLHVYRQMPTRESSATQ